MPITTVPVGPAAIEDETDISRTKVVTNQEQINNDLNPFFSISHLLRI
jgi:hypothetical protein